MMSLGHHHAVRIPCDKKAKQIRTSADDSVMASSTRVARSQVRWSPWLVSCHGIRRLRGSCTYPTEGCQRSSPKVPA